jgi:hypothetical protein
MRDLEKIVQLGREFAKPWKRATQLLSILLVLLLIGLMILSYKNGEILLKADFNNESEITQVQG